MLQIRLIEDPFDLAKYSEHESDDLLGFLKDQFEAWPATGRIYLGSIAIENDVTPQVEGDIEYLTSLDNEIIYVVVYPGDPTTIILAIIAIAALAVAALMFFLAPKPALNNNNQQSANNQLGNRTNVSRPNSRIPDIFGSIISVPELLTVPLTFFENDLEREVCYMCIGRGDYNITNVRDGDTPITQIAGSAAKFYGPHSTPNGGTPFLDIGDPIDVDLMNVVKTNEVNGQLLLQPASNALNGDSNIRFHYPDTIETDDSSIDFTKLFAPGDQLIVASSSSGGSTGTTTVTQSARFIYPNIIDFQTYNPTAVFSAGQNVTLANSSYAGSDGVGGVISVNLNGVYLISSVSSTQILLSSPDGANTDWDLLNSYPTHETTYGSRQLSVATSVAGLDLDGTYNVLGVTTNTITLATPDLVNAAWDNVNALPGNATDYISPNLSTQGEHWIGPFIVDMDTCDKVLVNIFADQGLYTVHSDNKQFPKSVDVTIEITPIDLDNNPNGPVETFNGTISGKGLDKSPKGLSIWCDVTFVGRCTVRVRRTSVDPTVTTSQIADEVKWRDCYGIAAAADTDFGDVTTVHTLTVATSGALSVKERKFNCGATRKVSQRNIDNTFGPTLVASQNAADIICHMALDPFIGRRTLAELDVQNIYDTVASVVTYFGLTEAGQFGYTFDQDNTSFEEMVQAVAQAVFCTAYRQGSILRLFFEQETNDSTLLFNHRNKAPGSEKRTITFGNLNNYDGVEFDYVSPTDGSTLTIYLPADRSATTPNKINIVGIQDQKVAFLQASRAWNKIQYQHTSTQFDALAEATQLILNERIEVADNTRPDIFDGEILSLDGLTLELSQPFTPTVGVSYSIFLQLTDGVESISITAGADNTHVVLQSPPSTALVLDPDMYARTIYQIVGSTDAQGTGFLLTDKGAYDKKTLQVTAINYDSRYYQADKTYLGALKADDGTVFVTDDGRQMEQG